MDNNNLTNRIVQPPSEEASNNKKMIIWLITGFIIVVLAVAGIYWYLGRQQPTPVTPQQTSSKPVNTVDNLNSDLNSIDVQASDSDFTSIDGDINNL